MRRRSDARLIARHLPLIDVEGANRDRPRRHLLDQAAIHPVLLVLGHALERAARQHELGSIEPDAFGAVLVQVFEILEQLDVGFEPDANAVGGGDGA